MDRFCVVTNSGKDKGYETSKKIREYLEARGKRCVITRDYANHFEDSLAYTDVSEIPEDTQCAIVLGGDGTFIQAAVDLVHKNIPLLGVNLGTMGYLTEADQGNIPETLDRLMKDDCFMEKRMLIKGIKNPGKICKAMKGEPLNNDLMSGSDLMPGSDLILSSDLNSEEREGYALNDIVIAKGGHCRLVSLELYLNGEKIETYIADGLIISTPTGSTGYNLSAGGPVLAPDIKAFVITPICPHSLNKRSMVISGTDEITVRLSKSKEYRVDEAQVMFDGRTENTLVSGDSIKISKADEEVKVVRISDKSFFRVLRYKFSQ